MQVILPSAAPPVTDESLQQQQRDIAMAHKALQDDLRKIADASGREAVIAAKERALADQERLLSYREEIVTRREQAVSVAAAEHQNFSEMLARRASELGAEIQQHASRVAAQISQDHDHD